MPRPEYALSRIQFSKNLLMGPAGWEENAVRSRLQESANLLVHTMLRVPHGRDKHDHVSQILQPNDMELVVALHNGSGAKTVREFLHNANVHDDIRVIQFHEHGVHYKNIQFHPSAGGLDRYEIRDNTRKLVRLVRRDPVSDSGYVAYGENGEEVAYSASVRSEVLTATANYFVWARLAVEKYHSLPPARL